MNMKSFKALFVILAISALAIPLASAGNLEPTAPPGSTMKTLDEIYNELTDGAIEINSAKAAAGSITPGDSPGFPITITESGSYILTSNLTVPDENTYGIIINADNVTIDLNGFALIGPNSCNQGGTGGTPNLPSGVTCTYETIRNGIHGTGRHGITVMNGTIQGMGGSGVDIGVSSKVINVVAWGNGKDGVKVSVGSLVDGVNAERNGGYGINGNSQTHIRNSFTRDNDGGIRISGYKGIIEGCGFKFNTNDGILTFGDNIIRNNSIENSSGNGIQSGDNSIIANNVIIDNGGLGLNIGVSLYSGNTVNGNVGGTVNVSAIQGGVNLCGGNATCP